MENILSLNTGQHIMFGFLCNSIIGQEMYDVTYNLSLNQISNIIDLVVKLTDESLYENTEECPDYKIMVNPENAFNIFCDWYDENETYIVDNLLTTETK
jgi:hypothetical protein